MGTGVKVRVSVNHNSNKTMTLELQQLPSVPACLGSFKKPWYDPLCGERGAWVAGSVNGQLMAVAERKHDRWIFWLVRMLDGETLDCQEVACAS